MAEKAPDDTSNGLLEKIHELIRKAEKKTSGQPSPRPFFPPPGLPQSIRHADNPPPLQELSVDITEPLDTASSLISSSTILTAAVASTGPTPPAPEPSELVEPCNVSCNPPHSLTAQSSEAFGIVSPNEISCNPLPSPKSPPPMNPRRLEKSQRVEFLPPSPESPPPMNPRRLEKSHRSKAPPPPPSPESPPPENPRCLEKSQQAEVPPPSPESPPPLNPRRLEKSQMTEASQPAVPPRPNRRLLTQSHRIEAPVPTPKKKPEADKHMPSIREDDLRACLEDEALRAIIEYENRFNEAVSQMKCMQFLETYSCSPPPAYSPDIEDTEPLEPKQEAAPQKKQECIVCKQFERLSLQKQKVHLSWMACKVFLSAHMHRICSWDATSDKPKPEFWLSLEYQKDRQKFDAEIATHLDNVDLPNLSTAVTLYLEKFMQVLYHHTPLEHVHSEEKCEAQLKELQTDFQNLLIMRQDILQYLVYEKEGFKHDKCPSYKMAMEWIKECTLEISDGLRNFETNLENLHLGRLIWSSDE